MKHRTYTVRVLLMNAERLGVFLSTVHCVKNLSTPVIYKTLIHSLMSSYCLIETQLKAGFNSIGSEDGRLLPEPRAQLEHNNHRCVIVKGPDGGLLTFNVTFQSFFFFYPWAQLNM